MLTPLLLLALAAPPLNVQVLERSRLTEVLLEADSLSCDGKRLPNRSIEVRPADRRLQAGALACESVTAEGNVTVRAGELTRGYPGLLKLANEAEVLRLINVVDVEDYLPSVVEAEASGSGPAALEVQAIVSRTFAMASRDRHARAGHELCDTTHCQLYPGLGKPSDAVTKTRGLVLLVGGVVLKPAFFHSSCGGGTSKAFDVFGDEGAGPGVSDTAKDGPLCQGAPDFAWTWDVERLELARALGLGSQGELPSFEVLRRDAAGRVLQLKSFGNRYSGAEFSSKVGRSFGWRSLRSLKVTMDEVEGTLHFKGRGFGHGVGLCQHGARALAAKGADAKAILGKYFPDCQIRGL